MYLGSHMSIAGGLHKAFARIRAVDGTALQIFTRNQRQWKIPPLEERDIALFREEWRAWGDYPVAAHDSYLINLASPKEDAAAKSSAAFAEELRRCEALGVSWLVTHPGSHLGAGVEAGIERYVQRLDRTIEASDTENVTVLLETTAGQGTNLGSRFEELGEMIRASRHRDRLGVCYDTCHTFAAGYDIRTPEAYAATFAEFDRIVGLERIRFFHLNDSKTELGERKDRHEHIGQGAIGLEGFRSLMNDPRFREVGMSLETDKEEDLEDDRRNLAVLRGLVQND
ncbi:deoxyribonuclease IV [Salidesulfovibrio onnuriiensis]|uniref:deoxyribonuclease IV n=1 Tax=Salidesulfovibrio onnuriiensis TaxID=2583823 RepID=UPI0011CC7777|nr:deoxyribonuclease IV [Salidesulfovibrio onnuriiensis]